MQMQLELMLPIAPTPVQRELELARVTWSYSRRDAFERCPRRYFYQYYAASKRGSHLGAAGEQVRFLKGLSNRHLRAGTLLHLGVAKFLRNSLAGDPVEPSGLARWIAGLFDRDISHSANDPQGLSLGTGSYSPVLLSEFYYGQPDAEDLCMAARDRMTAGFETFCESPSYAQFREPAIYSDVSIEKSISIPGLPFKVRGQVDLAFRDGSSVFVVDWKLGDASSADDSLQLAAYALWACRDFGVKPEAVHLVKSHLASGTLVADQLDEVAIRRGRVRIMQDVERMAAMDGYGRDGNEHAFTPCAQPAVCSSCPFLEVCHEGRACLGVGN